MDSLFYELQQPHMNRLIRAERVLGMNFGRHMHYCFEFFCVTQGEVLCMVDRQEYRLEVGQAVLVLPHQAHSYRTEGMAWSTMFLFDPSYVAEFYNQMRGREFTCPVFPVEPSLVADPPALDRLFAWKGLLYTLCDRAAAYCATREVTSKNDLLIRRIAEYVNGHNDGGEDSPSMQGLAEELGYSYHYLSALIRKNFGIPFCTLVNQYRVDRAIGLLQTGDFTVTEVAERSGFSTIRSFNRAFKQIQGVTPTEWLRTGRLRLTERHQMKADLSTKAKS